MAPIQIILLAIILFLIFQLLQKRHKGVITSREFFLWAFFWVIVASIVTFPKATDAVAGWLGVGRGADLIVYIAVFALFCALFFVLIRIEKMERDITKIVRKLALGKTRSKKE